MKKTAFILILTLTLISGKAAAQCIGDLTANISGGTTLICINTSPGSFTAAGGGESGSYTYLWYQNGLSTGITTQTFDPGILTANTTVYCAVSSGVCGPVNTLTMSITVLSIPTAPVIETIVQPTCTASTGSVPLSGLPTPGDWIISISPGGASQSGNGSTATINFLAPGTYTFKVKNAASCESPSSENAVIQAQPLTPTAPVVGTITVPTCPVPTGSVLLSGLPTPGTWTLTRLPNITTINSGSSYTITGLPSGVFFYTVTNQAGCTSSPSADVTIPAPPAAPSAPVVGTITQPTCAVATGSVALSGLPGGNWTVTVSPGGRTVNSSGTTTTISAITPGTYTFTVTDVNGCLSASSSPAVITAQPVTPSPPGIGVISQPTCSIATGSVVLNSLPSGSWTLVRTPGNVSTSGSGLSTTISSLDPGTYTFIITNDAGCTSSPSSNVVITAQPASPALPVVVVDCSSGFNHAVINVTSPLGVYQYSLNGGAYQSGTSFSEKPNGSYFIAVRNSDGCITVGGIFAVSCGCMNAPALALSVLRDSTCGTAAVTVADNTFGGSATNVTIATNGAGSLDQSSFNASPFSFTYTPVPGDFGKTVLITVTTDNPLGSPCSTAVAVFSLYVNAIPSPPSFGPISSLTCTSATGSVVLNGLPATGIWTLTRLPDNVIISGTNTSTTVTGLAAGTYTFRVKSAAGCTSAESAQAVINPPPASPTAPILGIISQPTCSVSTGSVDLTGLPATGTYILTRLPSGVTRTGSGVDYTVPNVPSGTFTFTVTNADACVSPPSASFTVNVQPSIPPPPSIGKIFAPTCATPTGSVILLGLPSPGTWTVTRYSGTVVTSGTGITDTINGLPAGATFNFTVTNQSLCVSAPSANVVIPTQPVTPSPPVVGTITQPTYEIPSGSVALSGLPSSGNWILNRLPDQVTTEGNGRNFVVTGLAGALYYFTVTNSVGCVSDSSAGVTISTLGAPKLVINDPPVVCSPATVNLTAASITDGSTTGLIYTYWTDALATQVYDTPANATSGTYFIKGTTVSDNFTIKPVNVIIDQMPVANAGPDQSLNFQFNTTMDAVLGANESGKWVVASGTGTFADNTNPVTPVSDLSSGNNIMSWIVTSGVCPADTDKVTIEVSDISIPTLITPNGDNRNEYFVILGLSNLGKSELIIFDRRGAEVFKNSDYDNKWNGVDYNENPLPNDTYFYVLSSAHGRVLKGYIVIRR